MKKIVPMNCSQEDFVHHLVSSGFFTPERHAAAIIDNLNVSVLGRPLRSNLGWSLEEDYVLVKILMELKTPRFISKILQRSETAVLSRMLYILGTSEWIRIVRLDEEEKKDLVQYFFNCCIYKTPYRNRVNILETVELCHFLKQCGFDASNC
jgi:hypothetical protein